MIGKYRTDKSSASHIRLGVGLILHSKNKLVLEQRIDCKMWGLIGGAVDIGETVEESVVRECFEETSIEIKKRDLFLVGIYSDINQFRIIHYPDNCFQAIDLIYSCEISEECSLRQSNESIDINFFLFDNLPKDIVPCAKDPINDFVKSFKE